ncbi:MAG: hemerythrin domain-containing protein [Gammaproteobacteria bacterium]
MANRVKPPTDLRQLGRSRVYTDTDIPPRLRQWHAPRINRWERLRVVAGRLDLEWLEPTDTRRESLGAAAVRWIAPGMRWRVANLDAGARFELEIHAENQPAETSPKLLREAVLAEAVHATVTDAVTFADLLETLGAGERRLVRGHIDGRSATEMVKSTMQTSDGTVFWHPLAMDKINFVALVARAVEPIGLADYLGHDHAVIEATLAGALRGEDESQRWLRTALERHLYIEEELLFPAYIEAGGREAWVHGLMSEHRYLRQYLGALSEPDGRRKFLRLLDGHDEKEERVVYPDILVQVSNRADALLRSAILFTMSTSL